MRLPLCIFVCTVLLSGNAIAQQIVQPSGGGAYKTQPAECVPAAQRAHITEMLAANHKMLIEKGILKEHKGAKTTTTTFDWPLHQLHYGYPCYYGISNYIDHDSTYPNHLQDWQCGERTYDTDYGYNHPGTDIFIWPFSWNMMEDENVEIIAAAPGTIIGKTDGNYDHDCAMSETAVWNSVYIEHADGTVAWYGHMKKGTPTSKAVGESVALGEHLGYVGSSGSSTGPHLHFEVHDADGNVRDPWHGDCNSLSTLWNSQKPYYEPTVNALLTHCAPPVFPDCPVLDTMNVCDTFMPGNSIIFAAYFHDQRNTDTSIYTVYEPDGTVFDSWRHITSVGYYSASYWYWTNSLPEDVLQGTWKLQIRFADSTYSHNFYVGTPEAVATINAGSYKHTVYPTPAREAIYISDVSGIDKAELINMVGQEVYVTKKPAEKIDISSLPAGQYFLKLTSDNVAEMHRVVKTE